MKSKSWVALFIAPVLLAQEKPGPERPLEIKLPFPKYPEPDAVLESMTRAGGFFRTHLSFAGGYARSWTRDLKEQFGEGRSAPTLISIQPPGTTTVGLTMVNAHRETSDAVFLQGAKEAAQALMWCQYASGGWGSEFQYELRHASRIHFRRDLLAGDTNRGNRHARSTLDDNKTQSAIRFLMELADSPAGDHVPKLREVLDFAWDGLLGAQAPNGGWPQGYSDPSDPDLPVKAASFPEDWTREFPAVDYTGFYTLNDNNLEHLMNLLLDAHRIESENPERFLEAAKRLGDFLLLAQMPEPQPVWAQQYNFEMHPAWARKFEPPAVCSGESIGAMRTLIEIWIATGEDQYIKSIPAALAWFERSQLKDKPKPTWARFYELQTNQPLYCEAETYLVTYDDSNLPTHYGFQLTGLERSLEKVKAIIKRDRDEILAERKRDARLPDSEKEWSDRARKLASKARDAMKAQKKEGYWTRDDRIDAGEFDMRMKALTEYLQAAKNGGEKFAEVRKKQRQRETEEATREARKRQENE
ncbi:MAG: hypothetical protein HKN23_06120 [Verrucomicrobiales bacterium]|nr:hypothetical protein [Verrucomicrobiales bacterium]